MNQAEKTFQARGKTLASRFESLAHDIRYELSQDDSAIDRCGVIMSNVQGVLGSLGLETLMKRAVLADKEQVNDSD